LLLHNQISKEVEPIGWDKNPLALATSQPSRSVLFIDAGGTDSEQLAAGAAAGTQVYRLTAGDAVDQITQVLAGMRDVDSVHTIRGDGDGRSFKRYLSEMLKLPLGLLEALVCRRQ
jgi:hypothetical protein